MTKTKLCEIPELALALSAILLLLPFTATAAHPAAEDTVVSGTVTTAITGEPLADVAIRVFDMATAELAAEERTSDEGTVRFTGLPFGLYQVSAEAPEGYIAVPGPLVFLGAERPGASVNLVLEPRSPEEDDDDDGSLIPLLLGIGGGVAVGAITIATVVENRTQ